MEENNVKTIDSPKYRLTLFSDVRQNFQNIKEKLHKEVSKALENELYSFKNVNSADGSVLDDEDNIPLSQRLSRRVVDNNINSSSTRRSRRIAQKRNSREESKPSNTFPVQTYDVMTVPDSDDEKTCVKQVTNNSGATNLNISIPESIDLSFDDDDDDEYDLVSVKINWMDLKFHRFVLRKHQKFATIFEDISEKENVSSERIILILRDKIFISKDDTPDSVKLSIGDIIEGGITNKVYSDISKRKDPLAEDSDVLELKCVLKDQKKPLLVNIRKSDSMYRLMVKAAEKLECSLENLKFKFEGDLLDQNATPEDLELEGGEVIEVFRT